MVILEVRTIVKAMTVMRRRTILKARTILDVRTVVAEKQRCCGETTPVDRFVNFQSKFILEFIMTKPVRQPRRPPPVCLFEHMLIL
jgi:hypothetical protein